MIDHRHVHATSLQWLQKDGHGAIGLSLSTRKHALVTCRLESFKVAAIPAKLLPEIEFSFYSVHLPRGF